MTSEQELKAAMVVAFISLTNERTQLKKKLDDVKNKLSEEDAAIIQKCINQRIGAEEQYL